MMAAPIADIRACVPGDEHALALVGQASFLESYAGMLEGADIVAFCAEKHASAVYRDWLRDPDMQLWAARHVHGGAVVGYLVLGPAALPIAEPRAGDLEIKRIYLLHRFHGTGTGRQLMDTALAHARSRGCQRVLLGVYAHNQAALAFYGKVGFTKVGTRTFRVGVTDCDDFILGLDL